MPHAVIQWAALHLIYKMHSTWLQICRSHYPKHLHQASEEFYWVWLTSSPAARKKNVIPVCSHSSVSVIRIPCLWSLYRPHSSHLLVAHCFLSYTLAHLEWTCQRRYWPSSQALRFQSLRQRCPTIQETRGQTLSLHSLFWSKAPEEMTVSH